MAVTYCTSFGLELLQAVHNFSSHTFKLALFNADASLGAGTTAYSTTNEISVSGYSAGGSTIAVSSGYPQTEGGYPAVRFDTVSFTIGAETSVRYGLIYNSSASNKAVQVIDFGGRTIPGGTIEFTFPLSTNPIINIAMGS